MLGARTARADASRRYEKTTQLGASIGLRLQWDGVVYASRSRALVALCIWLRFSVLLTLFVPVAMLWAQGGSSNLPPQRSPIFGGAGGRSFALSCAPGRVLTGLRARVDAFVFAVGITCRPILPDGALGPESAVGELAGGTSGTPVAVGCSSGHVIAAVEVRAATYLQALSAQCSEWDAARRRFRTRPVQSVTVGAAAANVPQHVTRCEFGSQPMVGIWGRAESLVDAVGFVCDEP